MPLLDFGMPLLGFGMPSFGSGGHLFGGLGYSPQSLRFLLWFWVALMVLRYLTFGFGEHPQALGCHPPPLVLEY